MCSSDLTDTGFAFQPKGETNVTGVGGVSLPVSALTGTSRNTTPFNSGAGIQETVTALNALGALVIGLGTNAEATIDPRQGLEALSKLTGAVNRSDTTIANGTIDPTFNPGNGADRSVNAVALLVPPTVTTSSGGSTNGIAISDSDLDRKSTRLNSSH